MAASSTIEWTESTWNPLVGCTKISPGCKHCYAERMSARLRAMALQAEKQGENPGRKNHYRSVVKANGRWSNTIELVEEALTDPLRWRNPRNIFVNSMSDLFHQETPTVFIQRVFEVMETASWHNFQVLTKRPERAEELASLLPWPANVWLGTSVENEGVLSRVESLRKDPCQGSIPFSRALARTSSLSRSCRHQLGHRRRRIWPQCPPHEAGVGPGDQG